MKTYANDGVTVALALTALVFNVSLIQPAKAFSFASTGSLNNERWSQRATLLNNGKVLVTGGYDASGVATATAEVYDPALGTWTATGSMHSARAYHTATLLPTGQVLVTGGIDDGDNVLATVELYDPTAGSWTWTNCLSVARTGHTATLLRNGKVLVAGGRDSTWSSTAISELYDPATGVWSVPASPLNTARYGHAATLLPDGRVLVAGGANTSSGVLQSAELFTLSAGGSSGTWSAAASMSTPRDKPTATLLPNGEVLVAGGFYNDTGLSSSELYAPDSGAGAWTSSGALNQPRYDHTATLLPNGEVLVAGGYQSGVGSLSSAELYDGTGTWTLTAAMENARDFPAATLLANGRLLVAGGYQSGVGGLSSAELFDPTTPSWTYTIGFLNGPRGGHTATLLPEGNVLVVAGLGLTGSIPYTEWYVPAWGRWVVGSPLHTNRCGHTATLLANGRVLVVGGTNASGYLTTHYGVEQYDPVAGTWAVPATCGTCHGAPPPAALDSRPTGHLHVQRCLHTATLLGNGKVLVAGGETANGTTSISELYDPTSGSWSLWPTTSRSCTTCHITPPSTGAWSRQAGHLHSPRFGHTATLMPDGTVLVVGGNNDENHYVLNSMPVDDVVDVEVNVELYDPVRGTWAPPRPCEDCHNDTTGYLAGKGHLDQPRIDHTATLLPNGKLLVAGGWRDGGDVWGAELYDPVNRWWNNTGTMTTPRHGHKATLLTNGKVLVTGGYSSASGGPVTSAELYDPASGTWTATASLNVASGDHTATLLPNGEVLVAGGFNSSGIPLSRSEVYDVGLGFSSSWQAQLDPFGSELVLGGSLTLSGSGFRGVSEGSCGNAQASPGNIPVVQLLSLGNEQTMYLLPNPGATWSDTSYTSGRVTGFPPGYMLVTMFVNGIPSAPGSVGTLDPADIPGTGNILDVSVPVPTPPVLSNLQTLSDGSFQFTFTNTVGALFGVLMTTNLSLPETNWTVLGAATEISLGQFQFADSQAAHSPQRFYRVYAP